MKRSEAYLSNIPLLTALASILWVVDGMMRHGFSVSLNPLTIVFYEFLLATIVIIPIAGYSFFQEKPTLEELRILTCLALISGPVATGLFTYAIFQGNTSFTGIFLLQKLQPIFALFFIWLVTKRTLPRQFFGYAFLALIGAFLVIMNQVYISQQWNLSSLLGILAALGAALAWGFSSLYSMAALKENSHQFVTLSRFFWGMIFSFFALLLFSHHSLSATLSLPKTHDVLLVIGLSITSALISFIIYFKAMRQPSAIRIPFLEFLYPLLALLVDLLVYHQIPGFLEIMGIGTILFATIKVNRLHNFTDLNEI